MVVIMVENIEEFDLCKRCHRKLRDDQSKKLGFGPVCYKKYLQKHKTYLFEMEVENEIITKTQI